MKAEALPFLRLMFLFSSPMLVFYMLGGALRYGMRYVHLPIGYDGVDEVHKATVARRVLKEYRPHPHPYFPTEFIPFKREEAWKKMQPVFDSRPDLAASAEAYKKYFAGRR